MRKAFLYSLICLHLAVSCVLADVHAERPDAPDIPDVITLDVALDYALQNSFEILQARERIEEQYGMIMEVRSGLVPNIALSARYSEQDDETLFFANNTDDWVVSIGLRQNVYTGGALLAALRGQKDLEAAALYDLQTSVEQTIQNVKVRFYDVLLARDSIAVQEQNVELLEEQLKNVESRFDAGSVSHFDVLQSQVSLANSKPALIRARNDYRIAVAELRKAVGYVDADHNNMLKDPEFAGELIYEAVEYDLISAVSTALQRRPELLRLASLIDADGENVNIVKAGFLPDVDLVARYDFLRSFSSQADRFEDPEQGWYIGLETTWNIWDGRATKGRVLQARSQMRQEQLIYNESRLQIEVEVRRAISDLQGARELVEAAAQVTEQAEESVRLANERYSVGSATFLETLQSRLSLTEARNNQLQANYSYLVAVTNLRRAIGETEFNFVDRE